MSLPFLACVGIILHDGGMGYFQNVPLVKSSGFERRRCCGHQVLRCLSNFEGGCAIFICVAGRGGDEGQYQKSRLALPSFKLHRAARLGPVLEVLLGRAASAC